ncbi:MAG TPA: phosphoglycerate dehydrogenase [Thermaerobacter sp.]
MTTGTGHDENRRNGTTPTGINGLARDKGDREAAGGALPAGGAAAASERPRVVIADPLPREELELLYETCEVVDAAGASLARLREEILPRADALIVRSRVKVTAELIAAAPRLRVIGRAGVGIDNIDLEAATERGIVVVNVADGNTVAVAEHVFALLLALVRRLVPAGESLRAGRWERSRWVGEELRGKVMGLIGFGRIGQEVAVRARAFAMRVIAYDPYVPEARMRALGVEPVSLEELLSRADVVSIHTPLTESTRNLLDAAAIARMRPGAYLINTARGGIVDEQALAEALREGRLAGAGIDVFATEPPVNSPLLDLPNVVVTPHLGGSTREAQAYNARAIAEQVVRALAGQPVRGAVNLPRLSDEDWQAAGPLARVGELVGLVYREGLCGPLEALELRVIARDLPSERGFELLAGTVLKGLLAGVVDGPVNIVNAPLLAARRGIELHWRSERDPSLAAPVLELSGGRDTRRSVAGSLTPEGEPRLLHLDGLPLNMVPGPLLLLTRHHDRPGMIGRVGSVLGARGINIAAMQVARREVRGEAIMVLAVDDPVPPAALAEIRSIPGMEDARLLSIPPALLAGGGPAGFREGSGPGGYGAGAMPAGDPARFHGPAGGQTVPA